MIVRKDIKYEKFLSKFPDTMNWCDKGEVSCHTIPTLEKLEGESVK